MRLAIALVALLAVTAPAAAYVYGHAGKVPIGTGQAQLNGDDHRRYFHSWDAVGVHVYQGEGIRFGVFDRCGDIPYCVGVFADQGAVCTPYHFEFTPYADWADVRLDDMPRLRDTGRSLPVHVACA